MLFTAAIVEVNDGIFSDYKEDNFRDVMTKIVTKIGYRVKMFKEFPFDENLLKKEVAKLIDIEGVNLVFVRNRGLYSLNDALFDLEDRSFRDLETWRRSWSRQRILYNEFNHAVTLVRETSLIMNFEGEFDGVNRELVDILEMWKRNCVSS